MAKEIIQECEKGCYEIKYILDNNESKIDTVFEGYLIKSPKQLELKSNEVILIASSFGIEIQQQLREMSLEPNIHYFNYSALFSRYWTGNEKTRKIQ